MDLTVDLKDVERRARDISGVAYVGTTDFLCSKESREWITHTINEEGLQRVVVGACSPRVYLPEFIEAAGKGGLSTCMVDMANIREQCAWTHGPGPEATRKAGDLVAMSAAKLALTVPGESGSVSLVKPGLCNGCGVCASTCRVSAVQVLDDPSRPGKKIAIINPKTCEGCGACVAACPSGAMDQSCFSNAQMVAQVDAATVGLMDEESKFPTIVTFVCHWCSSAAADQAGIKRLQTDPRFRPVRTMCSARVDPEWVLRALSRGADGVLILAGKPGRCHYEVGSIRTNRRMVLLKAVLMQLGFDEDRFRTAYVDSDETATYQKEINEFIARIIDLGPNPVRTFSLEERHFAAYQFQGGSASAEKP
jgi:coenzyme F420-reducing hydrogenase delta subunit/Pyruvate/2-oxoacid:ferredoxin oxidoreductase delta subunit